MKSWKVIGMAGLMLTSLYIWSGPVQAQYYGHGIDQREAAEEQRIKEGVRSGAITPQEAERLAAEQRRIRAAEARMRADGRLDPRERARLNQMLNKADRDIYRESHDNQAAYSGYGKHHKARYQHENHPWSQRRLAEQERHGAAGVPCGSNPGERSKFSREKNRNRHNAWNR
jgi:hypothetical protein